MIAAQENLQQVVLGVLPHYPELKLFTVRDDTQSGHETMNVLDKHKWTTILVKK